MPLKINIPFPIGAKVHFVAHKDIIAVITAVTLRANDYTQYEVCWFASGQQQVAWVDCWRISLVEQ